MINGLDRNVVGGIVKPLIHAATDQSFVDAAAAQGLSVALPGQAWRNQLPFADKQRQYLRDLGYLLHERLDPAADALNDGVLEEYAASYVDAALARGATIVDTPGHVQQREFGVGRENDLRLAAACVREWRARQADRPAPDGRPRALLATVMVQAGALRAPELVARLARDYAALEVDGFWVSVVNGSQGLGQVQGATQLALALQRDGGFCVLSGVGAPHVAALARGVAATSAGHHGMSPKFPPDGPAEPLDGEDADDRRGVHVYHSAILGYMPLGGKYAMARQQLFAVRPCGCGHHSPETSPEGAERARHNLVVMQDEARLAIATAPSDAASRFDERIREARELRTALELGSVKPGWKGAAGADEIRADDDADAASA